MNPLKVCAFFSSLIIFQPIAQALASTPELGVEHLESGTPSEASILADRQKRTLAISAFAEAQHYEDEKQFEKALELYNKASEADPNYQKLKVRKASVLLELQKPQEALELLQSTSVQSAELHALKALAFYQLSQFSNAQKEGELSLQEIPNDPSVDSNYYIKISSILNQVFSHSEQATPKNMAFKLFPLFQKAASLDPNNSLLQFRVAELSMQIDKPAIAADHYQKVYDNIPDFPGIRERMIVALLASKQELKAIGFLENILKEEPERKNLYPILAELYERNSMFEKAEDYYMLDLKLTPEPSSQQYINLALIQIHNKRFHEADKLLTEAETKFPTMPQLPLLRGLCLRCDGQYDSAINSFQQSETLGASDPSFLNSNFYFEYGATMDQAGKNHEAEALLKKSLLLNPRNHMALNYLGYIWIDHNKNLDEAKKMIHVAMELDPQNPAYMDSMGWYYYRKGDYQEARKWLEKAVQIQPVDPTIYVHLGDTLKKLGDPIKALAFWKKAQLNGVKSKSLLEKINHSQEDTNQNNS